jgi:ParB-like chromosome segregation protein Spo0J
VDGEHRLHAHRAAGRESIRAVLLDASLDDVELMALAIEANARHGRPTSTGERTGQAIALLACGWNGSDAELARRCGIARARVPELRIRAADARRDADAQGRPDDSKGLQPDLEDRMEGQGERRVGRGGRSYPGDPAAQRKRILDEAGRQPSASNAAIARAVGCSPTTVASVRAGIQPGVSPSRLGQVLGRVRWLIGVLARLFVRRRARA